MAVEIFIEGERIDLFSDETITIRSSVQDVRDISKIFTDFSQSFTVPASAKNNNTFKRYYNADVDGGFDARIRKAGTIDIDTLDFKRGKFSLLDVKIVENNPVHYRIGFFGDTVKIKDLLGDDKLTDLDWLDNFNHDYSSTNVKTGLTTGLDFTFDGDTYTKAVCYPLISYKKQWYYSSDSSDDTSTDTLLNIAYYASKSNGISFSELRPALRLELVLQAITEKYGLTFTQNFFSTEIFKQIFVNIYNNQSEDLLNGIKVYEEVSGTTVGEQSLPNDVFVYKTTVTPKAGFESIPYKIKLEVNDAVVYESANFLTGTNTKQGKVQVVPSEYDNKATVITEVDFEFNATTECYISIPIIPDIPEYTNSYTNQVIDLQANITSQIKDIKVYDFLTGLIKMFNLVIVPQGDDLYINDLQSWYVEGAIYDITPYVNTESETVKKSDIYNILAFKFKQSKSILANFFKQNNNTTYGNLEHRLEGENNELIDGTTLDIQSIFENPIFERLYDLDTSTETSIQYGLMADENLNSQVGEPFLMYLPSVNVSANSIGFNDSTGAYEEISTTVLMPSHSKEIDTASFNLNFNAEINEYTSEVFEDTLYQRYYADYIGDIFSIKRRMYDYSARLPLELKNKLKLNDRLLIRDRRYLINSITTNLTDYTETLELINDIYDAPLASDILNTSVITPTGEVYSGIAQTDTFQYVGLDGITASKIDTGDGVTWVTLVIDTSVGVVSNISFDIDENTSSAQRTMQIQMVDGINDPTYT
ncbi:MAG: hypothetical protein KUG81_10975, partial [Gammaproteobacteria bacterium]|nr:hypothetical protein [Gammaproteobacteria bacterium]